jgi:hypothetical protein
MAKGTRAHGLFSVWTPDQVAECLDGVPLDLSGKLWEYVRKKPRNNETPELYESDSLARRGWRFLTEEERKILNACAEVHMAQFERK